MKIIIIKDDGSKVVSENFMLVNFVPEDADDVNNFTAIHKIPLEYLAGCLKEVTTVIRDNIDKKCECEYCRSKKVKQIKVVETGINLN